VLTAICMGPLKRDDSQALERFDRIVDEANVHRNGLRDTNPVFVALQDQSREEKLG
jgi:hypothetical protein